jgi:hypothetical protein
VLVFSHGFTGFGSAATSLVEDLASHGYVVLCIVRPYESGAMRRQDGRVVSFVENGAPRAHIQKIFKEWADEDAMMASVTKAATPAEAERVMRGYLSRVPRTHDVVRRWTDDIRLVLTQFASLPSSSRGGQLARRADFRFQSRRRLRPLDGRRGVGPVLRGRLALRGRHQSRRHPAVGPRHR